MDKQQIEKILSAIRQQINMGELSQVSQLFGIDTYPMVLGRALSMMAGDTVQEDLQIETDLSGIHSETTPSERKFLYNFFRNLWNGSENVLEVGPFLGGTTRAIAMGMLSNSRNRSEKRIYTYDKFSDYYKPQRLIEQLEPMFDSGVLGEGVRNRIMESSSFKEVFQCVHQDTDYFKIIDFDTGILPDSKDYNSQMEGLFTLPTDHKYSAVFVDGAKSWYGTKYFMQQVLPKTNPGTYYIFQDYGAHTCFWIPVFIALFPDCFRLTAYVDQTYAFLQTAAIPLQYIDERFPDDPAGFNRLEYERIFKDLKLFALESNNTYCLMNFELQHAAALAYIGEFNEARIKIVNLLNSPFALKHRSWILRALETPTYTPEGNINLF